LRLCPKNHNLWYSIGKERGESMELNMIVNVIIGVTIFEFMYWLISVIVESTKVTKLDEEAVDYLIQTRSKNQNAASQTKEKKED